MQACVHIVDDDASFLVAMERRLRHAGYAVATYASALHLLVNLPTESIPSCILLDVRIPGLDGPALQKRLAELGSTLPIIFLTGYIDIPVTVQAIKSGAADVLTKPVSSDDLLRAIEVAIAHHEVTRALKSKLDMVRAHVSALTPRERQVFDLVIRGNTQQAGRPRIRLYRTHHQGSSPQGDGENAGSDFAGTCVPCRTHRRCVRCRTDRLGILSASEKVLCRFPLWNPKPLICVKVDIRNRVRFKTFKTCRRTGQGCRKWQPRFSG